MALSYSNSPASTLFPNYSIFPNNSIFSNSPASTLFPNYADQFEQTVNPRTTQLGSQLPNSAPQDIWTQGFNALSNLQLGGTAGNILNSAGKIGSSIKMATGKSNGTSPLGNSSNLKIQGWGQAIGAASDLIGSFMPQKSEYDGAKGDITQTMDSVYDGISDAAMAFGPIGSLVGGIMKGGAMLGKGVNALGGGTDAMTTTDAILGSSFLNLTPLGLVNGFGGKRANSFTMDNEAFAQVGSSYTGSYKDATNAASKSRKKYGLFSSGSRRKANRQIAEALRQQDIISDIADYTQDQMDIKTSMAAINGNRQRYLMQGGYDQTGVRVGKNGMILAIKARNILKAQQGVQIPDALKVKKPETVIKIPITAMMVYKRKAPKDWETIPESGKPSYADWVKDVNPDYINPINYDLETAYNYLPYDQMQRWKFAVNSENPNWYLNYQDENGVHSFHTGSVAPLGEDFIFLKKGTLEENPEIKGELDYYNNDKDFNKQYSLSYEGDRYYYRKKAKKHKDGGSIIKLNRETIICLTDPKDVPEFENGGSINVIPDGALHARKHHMETEGITEKGIPVVTEKENGKVEQQAEIEKEEVIFRLSVTQKLEKLQKKYYNEEATQKEKDEYALEAGKLITEELLHNTQDNVGLLQST